MPPTVPVNVGLAKSALRSNAAWCAVDTGLPISVVLSTLVNPTIALVMPPTVPVNVGLAKFALRSNAACWSVDTGLPISVVLSTFPNPTIPLEIPFTVPVNVGSAKSALRANSSSKCFLFTAWLSVVGVFGILTNAEESTLNAFVPSISIETPVVSVSTLIVPLLILSLLENLVKLISKFPIVSSVSKFGSKQTHCVEEFWFPFSTFTKDPAISVVGILSKSEERVSLFSSFNI